MEKTKLYTLLHLAAGAFLGGPLCAGYMLMNNYKAQGNPEASEQVLRVTAIFMVAMVFLFPFLQKVPPLFVPLSTMAIAYAVGKAQGIEAAIENKARYEPHTPWRFLAVSVIGSVASLLSLVVARMLLELIIAAIPKT
jgi:hypothetical protein